MKTTSRIKISIRAAAPPEETGSEPPSVAGTGRIGLSSEEEKHRALGKRTTSYRLHFDAANLPTIALVRSGRLGELRYFSSTLSFKIPDLENISPPDPPEAGPLNDIGIYCIDAARYLFAAEPTEVFALFLKRGDPRFREGEETSSVIMRFPQGRVASFTVSFGSATLGRYQLVGTKGNVTMTPAYEDAEQASLSAAIDDRVSMREGQANLRVLEAIYESVSTHQRVKLPPLILRTDAANQKPEPANAVSIS